MHIKLIEHKGRQEIAEQTASDAMEFYSFSVQWESGTMVGPFE